MKTKTHTLYHVTYEGFHGHFSEEGYSKYYHRTALDYQGALQDGEQIYGYEQALEHIKELKKESITDGRLNHWANVKWIIEVETVVTTYINVQ